MYPIEELHPQLEDGDIVLFAGKGNVSAGIRLLTRNRWSHVGMVVRSAGSEQRLLWESTVDQAHGAAGGRIRAGVQATPLAQRVAGYGGRVAIRRLEVERTPAMLADLLRLRRELRGRPFEQSHVQLFRSAYDGPWGDNPQDLSSLFCSELVAEAYQRMGLLPARPRSSEYTPADFSSSGELPLLRGRLGPELVVRNGG